MIKNECDIIKDLIPSFVDGTLSDSANKFIEEHLKNCENCEKSLEIMKKKMILENDNDTIDFLKKYNKKIKVLKIFLTIIIIFLLTILITISIIQVKNKINNKKIQETINTNYNIISNTYKKTLEFLNNNNFTFTIKSHNYNSDTITSYYFKDQKFKKVYEIVDNDKFWTDYGVKTENGYNYIQFYSFRNEGMLFRFYKNEPILGKTIANYKYLELFYKLNNSELSNLEIKDDIYQGKKCYVIKYYQNNSSTQWIEMYIDKENMLIVREAYFEDNLYKFENSYSWTIENVTDKDILIKDLTKQDNIPYYNETLELLVK